MPMASKSEAERADAIAPEDCRRMEEVRAAIDDIDGRLVALMAERQCYVAAAARIKNRFEDVRLQWRIEEVVGNVLAEAEVKGLSKRIAESVWRELIDRSIEFEQEQWRLFHSRNEGGKTS